ncbi:hypothetical protein SISNIDRAFT_398655, partial [Sistotremastrum niveocremeum HHB9708]
MTVHKAQGQSMDPVMVDLSQCRGTEEPYTMISRARSLAGLIIIRPFKASKLRCPPSEEYRLERDRLNKLTQVT